MAEGDVVSGSQSVNRSAERRRTLFSMGELRFRNFPPYLETRFKEDVCAKKEICMCLEGIETDILLGRPIQWDMLLPLVREMGVKSATAPECLKLAIELLHLFERHQCKDASVILEVFMVMIFLTAETFSSIECGKILDTSKFIYKPYGTEIDFRQGSVADLVYQAVRSANVGLLKLQLRFGLGILTPYFTPHTSFACDEILLHMWPNQTVDRRFDFISGSGMRDKICSGLSPESRKRHCLVLRVLDIVRKMHYYSPRFSEEFAQCYRLLFESIPEAYVTSVEMKTFLEKNLRKEHSGLIPEITEAFEKLLPKLAEILEPRSLQHLCRIQVRDSLRQNLNLPHGVPSLRLPTCLKDYIMLHDDGDYSIVTRTDVQGYSLVAEYTYWPRSFIKIPERDDCVTSFLKNL